MTTIFKFLLLIFLIFITGCDSDLPVLGPKTRSGDQLVLHPVRPFTFTNQYGHTITHDSVAGKARVASFFFTSCPTICPVVQREMLRIHEHFAGEKRLVLLSHSIDPKRDTVGRLYEYARQLGVTPADQWHFLTGNRDSLFDLAADYWNVAVADETAPGGFDHTGRIVLVDADGYIRAYAPGTDPAAVDTLIDDITTLLRRL